MMAPLLRSALLVSTLLLGACGGGGGNPGTCHGSDEVCFGVTPTTPSTGGNTGGTDSLAGTYTGITPAGRALYAVVEDDNTLWLLYSAPGASLTLAGAEEGDLSASGNVLASSDLVDVSASASGLAHGTLNGTYTVRSTLAGTTTFVQTANFTATYDTGSDVRATFADAAGTFNGTAVFAGASESATMRVDPSGAISGQMAGGCSILGAAVPQQNVRAFTVSLTFQGGACPIGSGTVRGVAIVRSGTLLLASLNASRSNGFVFSGSPG